MTSRCFELACGSLSSSLFVLGRPTAVYVADIRGSQAAVSFGDWGSRQAARETLAYNGATTTVSSGGFVE